MKNLVLSYTVSCVQAKAFVEELEFTEGKVEVAVLAIGVDYFQVLSMFLKVRH